eukprot:366277-Chlamydomonas_euryale.AAC.1
MDAEAQMQGTVSRANRALGEMYETGTAILTNMASNRERLKVSGAAAATGRRREGRMCGRLCVDERVGGCFSCTDACSSGWEDGWTDWLIRWGTSDIIVRVFMHENAER